jgi:ABC-2 type transport system ATP-binding protein
MSMIQVQGLRKHYGDHVAVDGLDFSITGGEVVGFLGPNGAGKSTTMKMLTGFIAPTAGSATVADIEVLTNPVEARRRVGYLPEAAPVYPDMQVVEYLDFVGRMRSLAQAERAAAVDRSLQLTGLTDRRKQLVGTLSKGYKQRVGLAQAILHDPDILILDEPTSGLDPNQIVDIRTLIRELGRKKTVVLSTHILSEVQASCDRVIIINKGRLVADGPTDEVTANQAGDVINITAIPGGVRRSDEDIIAAFSALDGVNEVRAMPALGDEETRVQVRADGDVRKALFESAVSLGIVLVELRQERSNLEDVFRRLTT